MLVTRTPFRVSFVGGGTDQEKFYSRVPGAVISTTIDKYIYVTVSERFDGRLHLRYSQTEEVDSVEELHHTIARECLKLVGIKRGVEIVTVSDIPARGSGLGSSSALTVGLLNALYSFKGANVTPEFLAEQACYVEIALLKAPIGRQDQYAVAYGGLNQIDFTPGDIRVTNLRSSCDYDRLRWLESSLVLLYLGEQRSAGEILQTFVQDLDKNFDLMLKQYELVAGFKNWLMDGLPLEQVGGFVDSSWLLKKGANPAATSEGIDRVYNALKESGALGAKVCGAGGGGFMVAVVPVGKRDQVRSCLGSLKELPIRFSERGSEVVYRV